MQSLWHNHNNMLKRRIIITTLLCIIIVGLPLTIGYSYLLQKANAEQIIQINRYQYRSGANAVLSFLDEAKKIALTASSDYKVNLAVNLTSFDTPSSKRIALNAHDTISNYISASRINEYVNRFIIINTSSKMVISAASSKLMGQSDDFDLLSRKIAMGGGRIETNQLNIEKALNSSDLVITLTIPIEEDSYLYMELTLDILTPLIQFKNDYLDTGIVLSNGSLLFFDKMIPFAHNSIFDTSDLVHFENADYLCAQLIPDSSNFKILSALNYSKLISSTYSIYFNTAYIAIFVIFVATILAISLSKWITRPVQKLINHIKRISSDKLVVDPSIEEGNDEFALIGKTLNKMSSEIELFIKNKDEYYKERTRNEIALLQSQVNPHFLYNTLESIRWMATIQKNHGIEKMVKSLTALLKDLSKGTDDIYPLEKELQLLENYVEIQKIRYLDSFEFINNIPPALYNYSIIKFTLQPIIENAIINGIDPSKGNGIVVIDGKAENNELIIELRDNGSGMDYKEVQDLLSQERKGKMTGIGIYNVNRRIKLIFGEEYGLEINSKIDEGTKVTLHLPLRQYV